MIILEVNQYVPGTMPSDHLGRLQLLSNNDRSIVARLFPRIDIASSTCIHPYYVTMPGARRLSWFRLKRRHDWLYYRGTSLEMSWPDNSFMLDDVTSGYGQVDLVSIKGLHYGQVYAIETHGGALEYAAEYPTSG